MDPQTKPEVLEVLPEIGRAVLVTGGFGLALSFSSLGLLLMSTSLALAIVLRSQLGLASIPVLALIVLCEILIFALAAGALVIGVGLFLKGLADALTRSFDTQKPGGLLERCGSSLGQWAKDLISRTANIFKSTLGSRSRQLVVLLFLGFAPPLLGFFGRSTGAIMQSRGIAMIKTAMPLSIYLFEYAGIALAIALSSALFIPKAEDQRKDEKPLLR